MTEDPSQIRDQLAELDIRIVRSKAMAAAQAGNCAISLLLEAVNSESLNVGAIRNAISSFERAANTLKPWVE